MAAPEAAASRQHGYATCSKEIVDDFNHRLLKSSIIEIIDEHRVEKGKYREIIE